VAWRGVAWRVVALTKRRFGDRRRLRNRGRDRSGRGGGRSGARRSSALFAPQGHEHAGLNTQAPASPSCGRKPFSACRHGVGSPLLQRASLPQRRSLLQRGSADAASISLSCAHWRERRRDGSPCSTSSPLMRRRGWFHSGCGVCRALRGRWIRLHRARVEARMDTRSDIVTGRRETHREAHFSEASSSVSRASRRRATGHSHHHHGESRRR